MLQESIVFATKLASFIH